jgi:murein DD-endopeptidase MepM/ murein hydrolase activator NlpD
MSDRIRPPFRRPSLPILLRGAARVAIWAAPVWTAACLVEDDPRVDTVHVTDTVVRVDTVRRIDTVRGSDPLTALDAGAAGDSLAASTTPAPTTAAGAPPAAVPADAGDLAELRQRRLLVPVAGVRPDELLDTFAEPRGSRVHAALDIPAPRGTPVLSADDGRVLKLHTSKGGGLSIYVADPTERFIYYYAHLDRYHPELAEGERVRRGEPLGAVGTTGNAPPNVPHLHFAIARSDDVDRWWDGVPIDPLGLLTETAPAR